MTAPLPVLGEKHVSAMGYVRAVLTHLGYLQHRPAIDDIEAHVRALVAGEVVEVSRNVAIHLREAHADWLTPQTKEKPK